MLKHGRAGVPMEVMGLMLGTFVDEYTVQVSCLDPFRWPCSVNLSLRIGRRRLCYAAIRYNRLRRVGRPCLPDEDVGDAQADWEV